MHDILFGTTIVASFIGGIVALFAPCCISVMLPAYFATSFQRTRALLAMTFVFAVGVATVILPVAFGASWISRLIIGHHFIVFLTGGAFMLLFGAAILTGWMLPLPMPGMQARRDRGPGAVFALGAFSGTASACCAPVLAGVVALSGAAGSFLVALAIGVAYVFGMVVPLLVIALLWDRYEWRRSRVLRGRTLTLRAFGRARHVHSTALLSGLLLMAMGMLVVVLAFTGTEMPRGGWQADLSARLQHYGRVVLSSVDGVPGWVTALVVFAGLGLLAWKAICQVAGASAESEDGSGGEDGDDDPAARHAVADQPAPADSCPPAAAVTSEGGR
jgi:cytochrome c biogenesis protein CcdA